MTNSSLEEGSDNSLPSSSTSNDVPKGESIYVDIEKLDVDLNPISNDKHQNNSIKEDIEIQPTNEKRFNFQSNRFSQKKTQPQLRRLQPFEIYKFADKSDIILMIIGTLAAILTGVCYSLLLHLYQIVTNNLVELGKLHTNTTDMSPYDTIQKIIRFYILLGFLSIFFYWIAWTSWIRAAERQVRCIRFTLFRNILRQDIGWFDVHNTGELNNRLINDLDKIKDGMGEKVPDFISLLARIVGAIIYALITGWKLTLVFLSVSPFIVLTFNLTVKVIVKYTIKEVKAFGLASSIVQEVLQNIRTVTAFHGQRKEEERFAKNLFETKKIGIRKGIYMGICQSITQLLYFVAFTVTFWYGPHLVRTECSNYSPGAVIVIFFACFIATLSTAQLVSNFQNFAEALGSGSYVFDIIERKTKINASSDEGDKPETIIGHIEFRNVTFTYPARQEASIFNKLSLQIPSGKTVALVGPSGCGKSTIVQLIQRFYDPDDGQVFLDGKDISTLNVAWLRSHIGIVSQEPVLFTGSIEDNIRFGKSDATDEEVQNAAKMANAHDFIMALPDNYKTTSGDKLSGGQKQRVAIARALISNPKILLLDEATSALDNTSEGIVQDALDKAKEGRTTIVIAHRLSTIQNADLIIGLEHGEVIENGTHDELMERKGFYYDLVIAQTQKEKDDADDNEDDDEVEREFVRQNSAYRSFTRQVSNSSSGWDANVDVIDYEGSDDPSGEKKFFRKPFLLKILKFNAPEWRWILLGAICSLINGATQPLFSLLFTIIYGLFAEPDLEKQKHLTSVYAGIIFVIGFIGSITQFLSSVGFAKSGEALTMRMRKLTFSAMLRQEIAYFDHEMNSVGALVTRLSSDASSLKWLTGARIGFILQAVSAIVTALAIAFSSGWKLTLVVLCFVPLLMLNGILYGRTQSKDSFTEQGGQYATQAIEHIRTVVALRQQNHFINLYEHAFNQEYKKQMCRMHLSALGAGLSYSALYFLHCANFAYGSKLVVSGEIKFDHVLRIFVVITFAMIAIGHSMAMVPDYSKAKAAALRIMKLHERKSKINPNDESGIILENVTGNIEFHDVDFRYPSRPTVPILRHFSLKCTTSETTALVGPSGSGKSTTIALLQRFYDPLKGKILLDGHDIKVLNLKWLRSIMSLVQQEPALFNLSIRDNIAYGDNSRVIKQNQIEDAARMANIHELIISLPQGYETLCGAKGGQLSGGQKQRIAIARALIRNPKILLLDEATSALDNKSEKVVQTTLNEAQIGRTCLTIAHRLSTIENAQKIAVVNRGKMAEEGSHDQLLEQNEIYAKLALAQQRSTKM